jgi:hypothetical protein
MKRIAVAIVLASLVLISCVVSVAATKMYAGDANVTWLLNDAGTVGWLYVQNGGVAAATTVRLALAEPAVIDGGHTMLWDGSYQYVLLPTALPPSGNIALTVTGASGKAVGLTGVELGDFYSWFTLPVGTQATVDSLVGGAVVVKSADGLINSLFIANPDAPARILRVDGSDLAIGGGLKTLAEGPSIYVDLGQLTVAGGVTSVELLGGEVQKAAFGNEFGALWGVVQSGTSVVVTAYNVSATTHNVLSITLYSNATIDTLNSFVKKADGTSVAIALTTTDLRNFDVATASNGRLQRIWLPVGALPFESVVVKIDLVDAPIRVFGVAFGNITQ